MIMMTEMVMKMMIMMTRMVMKIVILTMRSIFPVEPVIETAPKSVLEVRRSH